MRKLATLFVLFSAISLCVFSEEEPQNHPIHIAVPSLTISPEARGAGMGDVGAATTADVSSQFWNPAKYVFAESNAGPGPRPGPRRWRKRGWPGAGCPVP